MIPRLFLPTALGAIGMSLITALAAEGRLDYLPPQPYFPASFTSSTQIACDMEGGRWGDLGLDPASPKSLLLSDFDANWYGLVWRAAQERSLYEASGKWSSADRRSVRFTWLRTFHPPVVVRIDETAPHQFRLTAKELGEGKGGYSGGPITRRVTRDLTPAEGAQVERALSADRVLSLPQTGCGRDSDGAMWIIDANDHGSYRFVQRWRPTEGPVRRFGDLMLDLTGWTLEPRY